jgi:carbohydrate diacid regulator
MTRFSVRAAACFVLAIRANGRMDDILALIEQYGGNSLDTIVKMDEKNCVLVKYLSEEENDYRSTVDYADFLVQSLREEIGAEVTVGVGGKVRELKDVAFSFEQATAALRYAESFGGQGSVHSYREFMLVKILEGIPETKLSEYLAELMDESTEEIFEDEEMLGTAEAFLESSLNVSETARNLYMHRNTLLYRLDKIEKATGLNIRLFSDAVCFRVLTAIYKLLGK